MWFASADFFSKRTDWKLEASIRQEPDMWPARIVLTVACVNLLFLCTELTFNVVGVYFH
jgi:hypothetical protein